MKIFTQYLAFVPESKRPSMMAFLTCLRYIFNSSVIPELLGDDELYKHVILRGTKKSYSRFASEQLLIFKVLVESDTMQFAQKFTIPNAFAGGEIFTNRVIRPLLETKRYFSSTLQSCEFPLVSSDNNKPELMLASIMKVRTLSSLTFYNVTSEMLLSLKKCVLKSSDKDDNDSSPVVFLKSIAFGMMDEVDSATLAEFSNNNEDDTNSSVFTMPSVRELEFTSIRNAAGQHHASRFLKCFPNLRKLVIKNPESSIDLKQLAQDLPLLEDFEYSVREFGDLADIEDLEQEAENNNINNNNNNENGGTLSPLGTLPHLKRLVLDGVCILNSLEFLKGDCLLEQLTLQNFDENRYKLSYSPLAAVSHNIRHLQISGSSAGCFDDDACKNVEDMISLETLEISNTKITSTSLKYFTKLERLTSLVLRDCINIGDTSKEQSTTAVEGNFKNFFSQSYFPRLQTLDLQNCQLKDSYLEYFHLLLVKFNNSNNSSTTSITPSLKQLFLSSNKALTDQGLLYLTVSSRNDDENDKEEEEQLLQRAPHTHILSKLEALYLRHLPGIVDISDVLQHCPSLQVLDVTNCVSLESRSFIGDERNNKESSASSSNFLPSLATLTLSYCESMFCIDEVHNAVDKNIQEKEDGRKVLKYLSDNPNTRYNLKRLELHGAILMNDLIPCFWRLRGLQRLYGLRTKDDELKELIKISVRERVMVVM